MILNQFYNTVYMLRQTLGTLHYDTESILQYSLYVSQSSYDIH